MSTETGRESDKFMLRLPDGMRDRIKVAADRNGRSMNSEIVAALEDKFPDHFTRDEVIKMVKASMFMINPARQAVTPEQVLKNRALMLRIVEKVIGHQNAEAGLSEIEASDMDISDITMVRYAEWLMKMHAVLKHAEA